MEYSKGYFDTNFSSGQAANLAVFSLLNSGEHVLLSDDIYGGICRLVLKIIKKKGIEADFVDMSDLQEVRAALRENMRRRVPCL